MDRRTRGYFKLGLVLSVLVVGAIVGYDILTYGSVRLTNAAIIIVGAVVGVAISYNLYHSFLREEKNVRFFDEEQVLLKIERPGKGVVFGHVMEGFKPDMPPEEVDIYLTNVGIWCLDPESRESVLYIPLDRISEMKVDDVLLGKYLRIRYYDIDSMPTEALLHVGRNPQEWALKLGKLLTGQI